VFKIEPEARLVEDRVKGRCKLDAKHLYLAAGGVGIKRTGSGNEKR